MFKVSQGWSSDQTSHSLTLSQHLQPSVGSHILSYKVTPHPYPLVSSYYLNPTPCWMVSPFSSSFLQDLHTPSCLSLRPLGFRVPTSWWRCSLAYPQLLSSLSCHIRIQQEKTEDQLRIWSRWVPQVTFQLSPEVCTTLLLVSKHLHSSSQGSGLESESNNCLWSLRHSALPFLFHNLLILATASQKNNAQVFVVRRGSVTQSISTLECSIAYTVN